MKFKEMVLLGTCLHKLPAELLDIIATQTDDGGLASMRVTCRELRDGSVFEFFRRHSSSEVRIHASERADYARLIVTSESPNVAMAQTMTQSLILPNAQNYIHVSPREMATLRAPSHIARLIMSMPHMADFKIWQTAIVPYNTGSDSTSSVLKLIRALAPQTLMLHRLVLECLHLDGDDLIGVLETHGQHLRTIMLRDVVLTRSRECMVALGQTKAKQILFEKLRASDDNGSLQHLTETSLVPLEVHRDMFQQRSDWTVRHHTKQGFTAWHKREE